MKPLEALTVLITVTVIVYLFFTWLPWTLVLVLPGLAVFVYEFLVMLKEIVTGKDTEWIE